jgi:outer membrane protein assembly factor BamE (lipoprotein component of BamABCDE complex)
MIIPAIPKGTLMAVACAVLLTACPVPLPPTYDSGSRQNVGDLIPDFIVKGETTRDDVLLRLGEPDGRGPGDRWFAYGSQYSKGGVLFVMAAGGGAGAAGVESIRFRRIIVRFDENGIVTDSAFVERVCPRYTFGAGGQSDVSAPCVDVAVDDAPGSAPPTASGVPQGEHVAAVYENVVWAVTLRGLSNVERRNVPGTLALTDRSLVFVGKRAAADGSPAVLRIPYAEMTHAQPGLFDQILIQLPGNVYQAFEIKQAGTAPGDRLAGGDVPHFDESPPRSVVGFVNRKIGSR